MPSPTATWTTKVNTAFGKLTVTTDAHENDAHEVVGWPYLDQPRAADALVRVYIPSATGIKVLAVFDEPGKRKAMNWKHATMFLELLIRDMGTHQKYLRADVGGHSVLSSNIARITRFDADLVVEFKNHSLYLYVGQGHLFSDCVTAVSAGKFVNANLKKPEVRYICLRH